MSVGNGRACVRVLHLISGLNIGGAETALLHLVKSMDDSRFEQCVVSLGGDGKVGRRIRSAGVPVVCLNISSPWSFLTKLPILRRETKNFAPHVIQGWMSHGNVAAVIAAWIGGRRKSSIYFNLRQALYQLSYERFTTRLAILLAGRLSSFARGIVCNSELSAAQHKTYHYKSDKFIVIPNGFDCDIFAPSHDRRAEFRRKNGFGDEEVLVGLFGRYDIKKGHEYFFHAASLALKQYSNCRFVLAGRNVTEDNSRISELVAKYGLGDQVVLLGERDNMQDLYAGIDVFVSASYTEAFPNTLGEAMACGVFCIATDVGECARIVGDTGLVVPPCDPLALSEAIATALEMPEDERRQSGVAARARIVERYSLPGTIRKYENLYSEPRAEK